jgi:uncharacterized protein YdiU (UPF0061 family)
MSVTGETIDYGPCAFMDEYDPATVFSAIDRYGRYAYGKQPAIAHWNLTRLAECLLPLLADDNDTDRAISEAKEALAAFASTFETAYQAGLRRKLGLCTEQPGDEALARDLLQGMHENRADFTLTFRRLCDAALSPENNDSALRALFADPSVCDQWLIRWRQRLEQEPEGKSRVEGRGSKVQDAAAARRNAMRAVNPAYIPRNHRVEAVIRAAVDHDDFGPFEELLTVLSTPFDDDDHQPSSAQLFAEPPQEHERVRQTFCGT